MSRLIVVSNRVPLPDEKGAPQAGGMAIALKAVLKKEHGFWMGWSGKVGAEDAPPQLTPVQDDGINYQLVDLSQRDQEEYYEGFANRVLWPIFHGRPDLAEYSEARRAGYHRVNKRFAELLNPLLRDGDVIWVNDYHLIPLAEELRKLGCRNRIGFFLHIPWPPADIFSTVPQYDTLLRGLSFCNLVGFHTDYDLSNFLECLDREEQGKRIEEGFYEAYQNEFRCGVFPISIDTANFESLAENAAHNERLLETYPRIAGYDIAIGVDRLDYSKGIEKRIVAFRDFLRSHRERVDKTMLLQITPKSRASIPAYGVVQKDVAELVGRVNGELGTVDSVPVHYINKSVGQSELAGLYRKARIGLVTPLRDGMNLVAKEYVASQDPADPGVLILSRFSGAARKLGAAMLVNPYDTEEMARTMEQALVLPLGDRIDRWRAIMTILREHDVHKWCSDFLSSLNRH
ncbi:trehalose-6-phosphate synthase [Mesorhizobium sp. SARCC-RB16n]|uniref:alpha,alpha-trehalose-phosphate synthase (UDP-forming) n=1 Tax=Mesorhizobium sp. SARCC-RB16n TaxID=2116687 RepID=UPI00122F713C|nr:trehalose-6-phosphate synthase [Mesorhizobium sp. SARCC-RB16n]KAA3451658.1 trehalose-6-phosphate synthase [Mesorhizobium sp. SARCC-RB16n]